MKGVPTKSSDFVGGEEGPRSDSEEPPRGGSFARAECAPTWRPRDSNTSPPACKACSGAGPNRRRHPHATKWALGRSRIPPAAWQRGVRRGIGEGLVRRHPRRSALWMQGCVSARCVYERALTSPERPAVPVGVATRRAATCNQYLGKAPDASGRVRRPSRHASSWLARATVDRWRSCVRRNSIGSGARCQTPPPGRVRIY